MKLETIQQAIEHRKGSAAKTVEAYRQRAKKLLDGLKDCSAYQAVQTASQAHEAEAFAQGYETAASEILSFLEVIVREA